MGLPIFNKFGDLPPGVYVATIEEVTARFGSGAARRNTATQNLLRIYEVARAIGKVQRFIIFGSYVTSKDAPNDVDVILVMTDDFNVAACDELARTLFDHEAATAEFGASIFWIRPSHIIGETVDAFVTFWQRKRDKTLRGIVEIPL